MKSKPLRIDQQVTLEEVFRMMLTYLHRFNGHFKNEKGEIIKGFSIPREEVEKILFTTDANGAQKPTKAERVHIAFGHFYGQDNPTTTEVEVLNSPTIIAFGLDKDDNALMADNLSFDYCDPCPSRCPDFEAFEHIRQAVIALHFPELPENNKDKN